MTNTRIVMASVVVAASLVAAACAEPVEPFSRQGREIEQQLIEVDREAERRMDQMIRDNEKLLEEFDGGDDSLPMTGLGGG
jgi:hypothetical protein